MPTCAPTQAPCNVRGLTWEDWQYSQFQQGCNVQGWLGAINDNTSIAPFGQIAITPSYAQITAGGSIQQVTIPAGAISIQATIDDEYAADYAITIVQTGGNVTLPQGSDLNQAFTSPLFNADVNGQAVIQGHGVYPQLVLRYPAGSKGFIAATYRGPALPITVTTVA